MIGKMRTRAGGGGHDDDPLDAAGVGPNALTGRPYTPVARAKWVEKWRTFPVYAKKDTLAALVDSFASNQVTVLVSGTGSGKTVLAPPLMLRQLLLAGSPGRVVVTIPKIVTVRSAAQTATMTLDAEIGAEIGYHHRGSPPAAFDRSRCRLLYATDGILLAQAVHDPLLSEYAAVIVDEAHERPVPTDMLLSGMRDALKARPEMRLVVMSATIDPAVFRDYYEKAGLTVGVVQVAGGTMHPIERVFLDRDLASEDESLQRGVDAALAIFGTTILAPGLRPVAQDREEGEGVPGPMASASLGPKGSKGSKGSKGKGKGVSIGGDSVKPQNRPGVILFVPTTRDAVEGCTAFARACEGKDGDKGKHQQRKPQWGNKSKRSGGGSDDASDDADADVVTFDVPVEGGPGGTCPPCTSLYGKMPHEAREAAVQPATEAELSAGRLFVATNVAESSLTLEGITHVVDTGLQLTSSWDAASHSSVIATEMASRAQITQRIGRAGRTGPGVAVLLYTKRRFEALPEYPPPAVLTVDVSDYLLTALLQQHRERREENAVVEGGSVGQRTVGGGLKKALESFAGMITPPTVVQLVGALSFLHHYGLVRVGSRVEAEDQGTVVEKVGGRGNKYTHGKGHGQERGQGHGKVHGHGKGKGKGQGQDESGKRAPITDQRDGTGPPATEAAAPRSDPDYVELAALPDVAALLFDASLSGDGEATSFGRWVSRASRDFRLEIWNALLLCVGVAHGVGRDAGDLALLLEATQGRVSSLWTSSRVDPSKRFKEQSYGDSDHAALLRILREVVQPALEPGGGGPQSLFAAGLAPSTWKRIAERVKTEKAQIERLAEKREDLLRACPPWLRPPRGGSGGAPLTHAIAAARGYHLCRRTADGAAFATYATVARSRCQIDATFARPSSKAGGGTAAVYEHLTDLGGRKRASCVTYVTQSMVPAPGHYIRTPRPTKIDTPEPSSLVRRSMSRSMSKFNSKSKINSTAEPVPTNRST